jgi:multidrug efflux pump subunit AcrA (membrane-fusion protein)
LALIWRTVQRETWRSPKRVVRLEVELDETDRRRMRPGMRFRGSIEVERVDGALLVDADSVFLKAEGPVVYRRTLLGHEVVPVELGRRNEIYVEVLEGLREGDAVSLTDLGRKGRST